MSPRVAPVEVPSLSTGRSCPMIADLTLLPGNPRLITTTQFQSLMNSIRRDPEFLFVRPVAVADGPTNHAGGIIYGGNMRVRAVKQLYEENWVPSDKLQAMGWIPGSIPADVSDIPEPMARERAIQDNNTWGQWNDQELAEMLYSLDQIEGADLSVLGFDQRVLDDLLASVSGPDIEVPLREDGRPSDLPKQALTTEERMQIYQNQAIRQVVLYFPKEEYDDILELLDWLRKHFAEETNTAAVAKALFAFRDQVGADDSERDGEEDDD